MRLSDIRSVGWHGSLVGFQRILRPDVPGNNSYIAWTVFSSSACPLLPLQDICRAVWAMGDRMARQRPSTASLKIGPKRITLQATPSDALRLCNAEVRTFRWNDEISYHD